MLGGDEEIVSRDLRRLRERQVAAVHLELLGEIVVSIEFCDFFLGGGCAG
jgi:hypothetical protein